MELVVSSLLKRSSSDRLHVNVSIIPTVIFCIDPFLDQRDRHAGMDAFRRGEKDILVATDVASKGLDFQVIMFFFSGEKSRADSARVG